MSCWSLLSFYVACVLLVSVWYQHLDHYCILVLLVNVCCCYGCEHWFGYCCFGFCLVVCIVACLFFYIDWLGV